MPRTALFSPPAAPAARTAEVRSSRDPSVVYTLIKVPGGLWRHFGPVLCKGFEYRQHCRHVEELEARDQHDAHPAG